MKTKQPRKSAAKRVTVKGRRLVLLNEADYEALLHKASVEEPDMPTPDADGNYPALAALDVLQARDILRARRKLGLSQVELARRAGVRPETLNRIEHGRNVASVPTIAKIERALQKAEKELARKTG
jgi:ribosome-binding protein aMBF1 (putative translation factor)